MQRTLKICLAAILLAGTASAVEVERKGRPGGRGGRGRGGRGGGSCEEQREKTIDRLEALCEDGDDACTALVADLELDTAFANCTELEAAETAFETAKEAVTDDEQAAIEAAREAAKVVFEATVDAARPAAFVTARDDLKALKDAQKLAVECVKCQLVDDLDCDDACTA